MGHTGGVGHGSSTPVAAMGTTGLAPSQAHELVNGEHPRSLLFSRSREFVFKIGKNSQRSFETYQKRGS